MGRVHRGVAKDKGGMASSKSGGLQEKEDVSNTDTRTCCPVEQRCPICLDDFKDKSYIITCFHSFCFSCVTRAAETSGNKCPMCKTTFDKVIHHVRANNDYEVFKIPPRPLHQDSHYRQTVQDLNEAIRNFRGYRTTMLPGRPSRSRSNERTTNTATSSGTPNNSRRRADDHVHVHISWPSSSASSSVSVTREQRREREFGRNIRRSSRCAPASTRLSVYTAGVRALPITEEHRRRTRDISVAFFKRNPATTHRLVPWLSREFEALLGEEHVEFMIQLVLSLIDKVDLESDVFATHLEPFLDERTAHFMHEFVSFAKSPLDIIAYDNRVQYDWPPGHYMTLQTSNTSTSSSSRTGNSGGTGSEVGGASQHSRGPSISDLSTLDDGVRQRMFDELVELDEDSCQIIRYSPAPIVIHGSDSESEAEEESRRGQSPFVVGSEVNSAHGGNRERTSVASSEGGYETVAETPAAVKLEKDDVSYSNSNRRRPGESSDDVGDLICLHVDQREADNFAVQAGSDEKGAVQLDLSSSSTAASSKAAADGEGRSGSVGESHHEKRDKGKRKMGHHKSHKSKHHHHHHHQPHQRESREAQSHHKKKSKRRSRSESGERDRVRSRSRSRERGRRCLEEERDTRSHSRERRRKKRKRDRCVSYDLTERLHSPTEKSHDLTKLCSPTEKSRDPNERLRSPIEKSHDLAEKLCSPTEKSHDPIRRSTSSIYEGSCDEEDLTEKEGKRKRRKSSESRTSSGNQRNKSQGVSTLLDCRPEVIKAKHEEPRSSSDTEARLFKEAKAIDEEIRANKCEILKSALRKERMELLHRKLHGNTGEPQTSGEERVMAQQHDDDGVTDQMLQDELLQLHNEIASKKKQLLRVVKHIEEHRD